MITQKLADGTISFSKTTVFVYTLINIKRNTCTISRRDQRVKTRNMKFILLDELFALTLARKVFGMCVKGSNAVIVIIILFNYRCPCETKQQLLLSLWKFRVVFYYSIYNITYYIILHGIIIILQ